MRAVVQRVTSAAVHVDNTLVSQISKGYLVLLGVSATDTREQAQALANKLVKLRLFADDEGKTNLSAADVSAEVLIVSQFTLYANTSKGNRPSFTEAAPHALAQELYEYFTECCRPKFTKTSQGVFAADMQVSLTNDGPFTIILES